LNEPLHPACTLSLACYHGHYDVVKLLCSHGAHKHANAFEHLSYHRLRHTVLDPLSFAAARGHDSIVSLLVDSGCDVQAYCNRALHTACATGNLSTVRLLLQLGADPNDMQSLTYSLARCVIDPFFRTTPLSQAVRHGFVDIVILLLAQGASVRGSEVSIVDCACEGPISTRAVTLQLVVDAGADVTVCNDAALVDACRHGHEDLVQVLVKHGADVLCRNGEPLAVACSNGHLDLIPLLLACLRSQHGHEVGAVHYNQIHAFREGSRSPASPWMHDPIRFLGSRSYDPRDRLVNRRPRGEGHVFTLSGHASRILGRELVRAAGVNAMRMLETLLHHGQDMIAPHELLLHLNTALRLALQRGHHAASQLLRKMLEQRHQT